MRGSALLTYHCGLFRKYMSSLIERSISFDNFHPNPQNLKVNSGKESLLLHNIMISGETSEAKESKSGESSESEHAQTQVGMQYSIDILKNF